MPQSLLWWWLLQSLGRGREVQIIRSEHHICQGPYTCLLFMRCFFFCSCKGVVWPLSGSAGRRRIWICTIHTWIFYLKEWAPFWCKHFMYWNSFKCCNIWGKNVWSCCAVNSQKLVLTVLPGLEQTVGKMQQLQLESFTSTRAATALSKRIFSTLYCKLLWGP